MFVTLVNLLKVHFGEKIKPIHQTRISRFIKRRRILKISANFYGRNRNCYSVAVRTVHRALVYCTRAKALRKEYMRNLWLERLRAATAELGTPYKVLTMGLIKSNILLNNKVLSDLAIWEPRTFECITKVAAMTEHLDPPPHAISPLEKPEGVVTRGML